MHLQCVILFFVILQEEKLLVVGGGAAGVYGAIHAKTIAPHLNVIIIEKGKPLSKVSVNVSSYSF